MDTHVIDAPSVASSNASPREEIRIPSVPEDTITPDTPTPKAESSRVKTSAAATRSVPLALPILGAAGVAGAVLLLISPLSPFKQHHPMTTRTVALSHPLSLVLAPAANLATAPSPEPVVAVAGAPRPQTITRTDEVNDLIQLGGHDGDPGQAGTANTVHTATPAAVHPAVMAPAAPISARPTQVEGVAHPAAAPADPVAQAAALRAVPMNDPQQVQVLQLVTELGILVRDQRAALAAMRSEQASLRSSVTIDMSGFERRLSAAEAHGAIAAAMGAPVVSAMPTAAPLPVVTAAPHYRLASARIVVHTQPVLSPAAAIDAATARYHVTAASPGLAMVSVLDASGGEARQLEVAPGEALPGYGRVLSIGQRGTAWEVKTEHGSIE